VVCHAGLVVGESMKQEGRGSIGDCSCCFGAMDGTKSGSLW
jgi:hypothetical protein